MEIEKIAKICHEANRAYCETLGDTTQLCWESAPEWQRNSAIQGVKAHLEMDLSPEESHERWFEDKHQDGWKYGETKDIEKKLHPCMVPYMDLPLEQRLKDSLFKSIVECFKE